MDDTEKKQAQAMLNAAIAQRNHAFDECIQLAAMITMVQEKIATLEVKSANGTEVNKE